MHDPGARAFLRRFKHLRIPIRSFPALTTGGVVSERAGVESLEHPNQRKDRRMTEWTRAERNGFCGGCDKKITVGEPIRLTSIVGIRRRFVRCQECAGSVPYDLPPISVLTPDRTPRAPVAPAAPAPEWMPYRDQ